MRLPPVKEGRDKYLLRDDTWIPRNNKEWIGWTLQGDPTPGFYPPFPDQPRYHNPGSFITDPEQFSLNKDEQEMIKSGANMREIIFRRLIMNNDSHLNKAKK